MRNTLEIKGLLAVVLVVAVVGCGPLASEPYPLAGDDAAEEAPVDPTAIRPFTIAVSDVVLDDLRARLVRTRLPDQLDGVGWEYGTELDYLTDLITLLAR